MKVSELLELLEDMPEDAEVRLAHQPSWPFEYSIDQVVEVDGKSDHCTECGYQWPVHAEKGCDETEPDDTDEPSIVYLAEGEQLGYLSGFATEAVGWGR